MRCKTCAAGIAHDFNHGANGYNQHGCRCDVCKQAKSQESKRYSQKTTARKALNGRLYRARNRKYLIDNQRQYDAKKREIPCPNNRSRWTPGELKVVARDDITITEMCYMLGRSYKAVTVRREILRREQRKLAGETPKPRVNNITNAKLNEFDVCVIRKLFATHAFSYREIADLFGVTSNTIRKIAMGVTWVHVEHDASVRREEIEAKRQKALKELAAINQRLAEIA